MIEDLQGDQMGFGLDGDAEPIEVSINQFYGIEINDFAVSVAKTALWIAEEQMMEATQEILLREFDFLPLKSNSNIREGNALRMDWGEVLPAERCSYVIGNPPFLGARNQSKEQKEDLVEVFHGAKNCGNVDYVAGWYMKAAEYVGPFPVRSAFVSTNSICQGEQVANIWKPISDLGVHIDFAHDTFRWASEASDQAHVFVVIVGFSKLDGDKCLFHHNGPDAAAVEQHREASMLTWRMRRAFSYGTAASRYATCLKSESVHSQLMAATTYSLNWRRKASWRPNLLPHVSFTLGSVRASFSMAKLDGVYGSEMLPYRTWLRCRAARRGLMPYATTGYQVKEGRP